MCGARSTGKSVYISVAIQQAAVWLAKWRTTIEPANTYTRDVYQKSYKDPLFAQLGLIPPTASSETDGSAARLPMIFNLGEIKGAVRYLVLRDVAGEEIESAPENATNLRFLKYADGVFFMFDPLAIPAISDKLKDLIPHQNVGGDPRTVLTNLRQLIGKATPRLAVIVSKFDALQALRDVDDVELKRIMSNPGAALMRDGSLDHAGYDDDDGELLSLEIESLLQKLGANEFVLSVGGTQGGSRIPHRYFAVSVLGESPDGDRVSTLGISPFRIVDPLKWLLDAQGVI
jgi:hypothetical protein